MKYAKLFTVSVLASSLLACGAPSADKLKGNKDLLDRTLAKCKEMGVVKAKDDEACQNALKAMAGLAGDKTTDTVNKVLGK